MRKSLTIIAISCAAAVAGCSKPEPAADATPSEAVTSEAADAASAATLKVGNWDVFDASGKAMGSTEIMADGTYVDKDTKGTRVAGLVKVVDGKTCFDPSGKAAEECFTEGPVGADGTFTATDAKGNVLTIKPKAK